MTVIAGVSLFNGVMLLADSRVTVTQPGQPDSVCDIAQKIMPITNQLALAFSGDVQLAAFLLRGILQHGRMRERKDPVSLLQWLPRFLRHGYRCFEAKNGVRKIGFLVAAIQRDRLNVVERKRVAALMTAIASGSGRMQRNWVSDVVMRVLMTPPEATHVAIPGSVGGILAKMTYPNFAPQFYAPLQFTAIGTGQGAAREIERDADWIVAGMPGNDMIESMALRDAVSQFIADEEIDSVGGMYPCVKIDGRGVGPLGQSQVLPLYEMRIGVDPTTGRWVQENVTTSKKQSLLYPWEINPGSLKADQRFDDWWEAVESFNPRRARGYKRTTEGR